MLRANYIYLFEVDTRATKQLVKKVVEDIFDVDVEQVRIQNVLGKVKRLGRTLGKRPDWKKAIVRIKTGQEIHIYEGV